MIRTRALLEVTFTNEDGTERSSIKDVDLGKLCSILVKNEMPKFGEVPSWDELDEYDKAALIRVAQHYRAN